MKLREHMGYITQTDAAMRLGIPIGIFRRLIAASILPGPTHKMGLRQYYVESDIEEMRAIVERSKK